MDTTVHLIRSTDRGQSWTKPWDTEIQGQITQPVYLPDGRLLLIWVDRFGTRSIRAAISTDHGQTFGRRWRSTSTPRKTPAKNPRRVTTCRTWSCGLSGRVYASLDARPGVGGLLCR